MPCGCFADTWSSCFWWESNSPARKQNWSLVSVVLSLTPLRFSSTSFKACWISVMPPLSCVICLSSSVGGAAVCGHPLCLQLGWMVALHYSSLYHWRAFCSTKNTGLIHSAQWDCSQFLSVMRVMVWRAGWKKGGQTTIPQANQTQFFTGW